MHGRRAGVVANGAAAPTLAASPVDTKQIIQQVMRCG